MGWGPIWIIVGSFALALAPLLYIHFAKWVRSPFIAHRGNGLSLRPDWEPTRLDDLSPEMREFLGAVIHQFREAGFEVAANVSHHAPTHAVDRSIQTVLADRATGDVATVVAILGRIEKKNVSSQFRTLAMVLNSRFVDGMSVSTSSGRTLGTVPREPQANAMNAAWVRDGRVLCEFHRRRVSALGMASHRREDLPIAGKESEYLAARWEQELQRMIASGYYYRDTATGRARLTWKGAILASWKLNEPIKSWRMRRETRRARHEWTRLGMDQYRVSDNAGASAVVPAGQPIAVETADLGYEAEVREGEVKMHMSGGIATVRIGCKRRGRYLMREGIRLIAIGIIFAMACYQLKRYWDYRILAANRPSAMTWLAPHLSSMLWLTLLMLLVCAINVTLFVRGMRRVGGITVLTASRDGLSIGGAGGGAPVATRHIPRDELHGLLTVRSKRNAVLFVRMENGQRLLVGQATNAEDLEAARIVIMRAIGMLAESEAGMSAIQGT